jgi:putative SOS response-associated peptidase YedK
MRWGMPPPLRSGGAPVTNIRNTSSPHGRAWLKPENRCLASAHSFAEYAPEPNPETKAMSVILTTDEERDVWMHAQVKRRKSCSGDCRMAYSNEVRRR